MSRSEDDLWDLLNQVYRMPYGSAQIALVEQVIAHADAQRLTELAFAARMQATSSYVYGGEPARSFVTFSWCLAEFDADPTRHARHESSLLWHFKYMVNALTKFPEIPLERTYGVLDDMASRWRATGHSAHAVHAMRHRVARHIGDLAAAGEEYARWCTAPRDDLSDCIGCDPSGKASWLADRGRDDEAVGLAEPVLAGHLTCSEQPQTILTTLLKPYLRTGRLDQARDAHRRAYRLQRPNLADLGEVAEHVEFCALTGNEARGVEILERHLGWLDRAPSPWAAMAFAAAGVLVLRRSVELGHDVTLHRPAHDARPAAEVEAAQLADELGAMAQDLAARFDARNGTDQQSRLVQATQAAAPLVDHLPLSPTAPRKRTSPSETRASDPGPGETSATDPAPERDASASDPAPGRGAWTEERRERSDQSDEGRRRIEGPEPVRAEASTRGPDGVLDLAEDLAFDYRAAEVAAVMRVFDERFAGADLTPGQRARRADRHAVEVAGRGELAEAEAVWRTAEQLFAEAGDDVGRHRVLARIGVVLCETDRVDEGLPLLLAATDRLVADGPPARRATAVLRLAQAYLTLGQPDNALAAVERAAALSPDPTPRDTAEVAVERLWVLRALGRLDEIQTDGPAVIELARASGAAPLIVRAHVVLASSHEMVGDPFTAGDLLTRAMAFAYDDDVARWLRQTRANILAETPRAAEVVDDLVEAVAERTAAGDAEGAARARHPLAIAYLTLGRLLDAAEVAEEELAALRDQDTDPTPVRYLLSTIYQGLGQPDEAIAQLEAIAATCVASGNRAGEAQMAQEVGDLLSRLDRDEQAAQRYQAAAALYHELGRPLDELANRRRHAISTFWGHGSTDAVTALAAADELAASLPDEHGPRLVWERATLSYDAARILWAAERPDEATDRIRRSAEGFRAIDAGGQAFAAETLQADLLLAGGDAAGAEAAARRALAERPDDAEPDRPAALLAAALAAQDRAAEAEAVRRQYGLANPDEDG